jgi:16S rRNA (cytidine1402-2'-O)-methyltransferase
MGTLYVVATPIGNLQDFSPRAVETLRNVQLIAAEDTRHSGTLRTTFNISTPMVSYHHHNRARREAELLRALDEGDVALISDAGTPAIADPGQEIVAAALKAGHTVVPIPGASAAIAAVSASGLVTGPFIFLGFVERKGEGRRAALGRAVATSWPVVLFESPQRLLETLDDLRDAFGDREAIVARELTKLHEEVTSGTISTLIAHFSHGEVRGEIAIVLGAGDAGDAEVDTEAIARKLLADGLKPSRAARELAQIAGISGDAAYEIIRGLGPGS